MASAGAMPWVVEGPRTPPLVWSLKSISITYSHRECTKGEIIVKFVKLFHCYSRVKSVLDIWYLLLRDADLAIAIET